jgi:hypothetical protein
VVVPFQPIEGRARWAVIALVAIMIVDLVSIGSDLLEIRLMDKLIDGDESALGDLDGDDLRQGIVALLYLVVAIAAAVFFIRWFRRAYENLDALGATRRYGLGWSIGSWFVPILNLWRPKQIANDIWKGSDPVRTSTELRITESSLPALLNAWWAAWIVASVLGTTILRTSFDTPTAGDAGMSTILFDDTSGAHQIRTAATLDAVASVIDVVAAVLAILVIRRLTAREMGRAGFLGVPDGTGTAASPSGTMA